MKKVYLLIATLLLTLMLASCNAATNNQSNSNIFQSKEIVLGNKVDNVKITNSLGVEMNVDNTFDFDELYGHLNQFKPNQKGKMISYNAKIKYGEESKTYVNLNFYTDEFSSLCHFETNKEGSSDLSTIYEYSYVEAIQQEGDTAFAKRSQYSKYSYKDELAFIGSDLDENGTRMYASENYPSVPRPDTELCDMQVRSVRLRTLLFRMSSLFPKFGSFEYSGKTYNMDELITSKYELYENYIVLEQNNPFLVSINSPNPEEKMIIYQRALHTKKPVNIKAYYNIHTGEVESVTMNGTYFDAGIEVQIDITAYVFDLDKETYSNEVSSLIDFIQKNSTK